MFERYQTSKEGNLTRRFLASKHEASYTKYRKQFEKYSAPLPKITEDVLEGKFINGLTRKLKAEVESRNPIRLDAAMKEAQSRWPK